MKRAWFNSLTLPESFEILKPLIPAFTRLWSEFASASTINALHYLPQDTTQDGLLKGVDALRLYVRKNKDALRTALAPQEFQDLLYLIGTVMRPCGVQSRVHWVLCDSEGGEVECPELGFSYEDCGMTLGFPSEKRWRNNVSHEITNGDDIQRGTAYCVSDVQQLNTPLIGRWLFCYNPRNVINKGFVVVTCENKHFQLSKENRPQVSNWEREPWVLRTRDGVAQFVPGITPEDEVVKTWIHCGLCKAMDMHLLDGINGFVCDVGALIGAADGKPTSRIEIYLANTPRQELHIRPSEHVVTKSKG